MIHFFHGQFDHPSLWNNYKFSDCSIKTYNLYDLSEDEINNIKTNSDDVLVGYSLGGRIALKIASNNKFNFKKLILLSSHPGLNENELQERRLWEEEVLLRLHTNSLNDFFNYWNSLPLFSESFDYRPLDRTLFKKSIQLFENNRLSNQQNYTTEMKHHKNKILYVFGYKDKKYTEIAWKLALDGIETFGISSDHRVHLHKKTIQELIQREIES